MYMIYTQIYEAEMVRQVLKTEIQTYSIRGFHTSVEYFPFST